VDHRICSAIRNLSCKYTHIQYNLYNYINYCIFITAKNKGVMSEVIEPAMPPAMSPATEEDAEITTAMMPFLSTPQYIKMKPATQRDMQKDKVIRKVSTMHLNIIILFICSIPYIHLLIRTYTIMIVSIFKIGGGGG
jgi:hypothetical protein